MKTELDHIGYATKSIPKSLKIFRALGYEEDGPIVIDKVLGVKIQFINQTLHQGARIELVENLPGTIEQPISIILKQRSGLYHLAYSVDSIRDFSGGNDLRKVTNCGPAVAFNNRHVQFFISRDGGLLELIAKSLDCGCENLV